MNHKKLVIPLILVNVLHGGEPLGGRCDSFDVSSFCVAGSLHHDMHHMEHHDYADSSPRRSIMVIDSSAASSVQLLTFSV